VDEKAGISVGGWSTENAFGDYDGDGKLDLFVAGFVHFDRNNGSFICGTTASRILRHASMMVWAFTQGIFP
jgi:hypothetical protein